MREMFIGNCGLSTTLQNLIDIAFGDENLFLTKHYEDVNWARIHGILRISGILLQIYTAR